MCIRDRDSELAQAIHYDLIVSGYIDRKGALTDKYDADKANGEIKVAEEVADSRDAVIDILDSVYDLSLIHIYGLCFMETGAGKRCGKSGTAKPDGSGYYARTRHQVANIV